MDTFVVRISPAGNGEPGLRGVVDEVASGLSRTFRDPEELVTILMGGTAERAPHRAADPPRSRSTDARDRGGQLGMPGELGVEV
jgi:hypothetical protein